MSQLLTTPFCIIGSIFLLCSESTLCAQDFPPAVGREDPTTAYEKRVLNLVRESTTVAAVAAKLDLSDAPTRGVFIQVLVFARLVSFSEARNLHDNQSDEWRSWVESHATARLGPILPEQDGVFQSASEDHFLSVTSGWQSACSLDFVRFGQPTIAESYHLLSSPNRWTRVDGLYVMARAHPDEFKSRAHEMGAGDRSLFSAARRLLQRALDCEDENDELPFTLAEGASLESGSRAAPGEKGVCPELWYGLYRALIHRVVEGWMRDTSNLSQREWEEISKRKRRD